jgi:hypothetical protein
VLQLRANRDAHIRATQAHLRDKAVGRGADAVAGHDFHVLLSLLGGGVGCWLICSAARPLMLM